MNEHTLQGIGELFHIANDEKVQFLAGPNRANQNTNKEADADSDGDGRQALLRQREQLLHTVPRHCNQAVGEDEYRHAVVESRFYRRYEPRKGGGGG